MVSYDLDFIEVDDAAKKDPLDLFERWRKEAHNAPDLLQPDSLCLATASKDGNVTSRHLLLRRLDSDGLVIMTDRRSKKSAQLAENPKGAITFLWCYRDNDNSTEVVRQVRFEGNVDQLPASENMDLYTREPFFCKIRAYLCHQGTQIDWAEHKRRHDDLVNQVRNDVNETTGVDSILPLPDWVIFYKLRPSMVEFYQAHNNNIADRVLFLKEDNTDRWVVKHIAA